MRDTGLDDEACIQCLRNEQCHDESSKLWSSQLWMQFKQLRIEALKSQDFNGVWTRDLAIPVQCSNQLSYEATDVGSWSFVSSNDPVKNGCEVIYEIFIIELRIWNQVSYDHRSYERNLSNWRALGKNVLTDNLRFLICAQKWLTFCMRPNIIAYVNFWK